MNTRSSRVTYPFRRIWERSQPSVWSMPTAIYQKVLGGDGLHTSLDMRSEIQICDGAVQSFLKNVIAIA